VDGLKGSDGVVDSAMRGSGDALPRVESDTHGILPNIWISGDRGSSLSTAEKPSGSRLGSGHADVVT